MPIAESQRRVVIEKILAVVRGMTNAAVYNYPVRDDEQVTSNPTVNVLTAPATGLPLYVVEIQPAGDREFFPAGHIVDHFTINVIGRQDTNTADPDARMVIWEGMAADLERAFAVDVTLDGAVYDVRLQTPQAYVGIGSSVVALVQPILIKLHRTYGEP